LTADRVAAASVAAGAFLAAVLLQAGNGAFSSEFGAHPDESAHYVTGVMVREYVAALRPEPPLRFAQDYYDHYPKVAIGHWPPGFYLLQAAWTLPFSPSRVSVLLLMAALTAALATTLFLTLRGEVGAMIAAAGALLFVALPLVQKASGMVMAELLVALLCFWAALALGRFYDHGRRADAVWCALASAAAILTKGNAFALAVAAPVAVVLTRRYQRLAQPALWASAVLVVALCAPWFALTARLGEGNLGYGPPTVEYAWAAARLYTRELVLAGGFGFAVLAVIGIGETVLRPWPRRAVSGKWAAATALLVATWAFHCVVPTSREPRHMVMALPALMMLVAAGIAAVARWAGGHRVHPGRWRVAAVAGAVAVFAWSGFTLSAKRWCGFSAAVDLLLRSPSAAPASMLIVSDARGEGMFISEVTRREPRPRRRVLRGSKALAQSGWDGQGYRLLHRNAAEVLAFLQSGVEVVVLDASGSAAGETHVELMEDTVRRHPERFERLGSFPLTRAGRVAAGAVGVWRFRPPGQPKPPE
jgi:4-amino-4-deoxy-L-arabinose transferase-like glycosyltransferase